MRLSSLSSTRRTVLPFAVMLSLAPAARPSRRRGLGGDGGLPATPKAPVYQDQPVVGKPVVRFSRLVANFLPPSREIGSCPTLARPRAARRHRESRRRPAAEVP